MSHEFLSYFWFYALSLVWAIYLFQESFVTGGVFLSKFIDGDDNYKLNNKTIGTHWDGIQVWFILASGGLFAAFPEAFGVIFSNLYVVVFLLIYLIIIRGICIEVIYKTDNHKIRNIVINALTGSSILLIFVVALFLNVLYVGVPVNDNFFSFITIFSLKYLVGAFAIVGFSIINGYLFLGLNNGFEYLKSVKKYVKYALIVTPFLFIIQLQYFINVLNLFDNQNPIWMLLAIFVMIMALLQSYLVYIKKYWVAFISGMILILSNVFLGFNSLGNDIVHLTSGESISILDGASGINTLSLMFYSLVIFLPIVIGYQGFKYVKFWGVK